MKLLHFGGSSSFLRSMKLARGGNHDSIVRLRCLLLTRAIFDCRGDGATKRSEEKGSTPLSPDGMVMADNLRLASRSPGARESSSSSSSLILMKFEWLFLGVPAEERSRPSKQARAAERFIRLVSDLIEREADEADLETAVRMQGPRARVGESGSGGSVMRNGWPTDKWGKESAVGALSEADVRTALRRRSSPGLRTEVRLDEINHSTVR